MWNYLAPLTRLSFWFSFYPLPFTPFDNRLILGVMAALVAASAVLKVWFARQAKDRESRRAFARFASVAFWAGLSGLVLYVFTWQGIPVLSMRFWYVAWFAGFAWWTVMAARFALREVPALRHTREEREAYEKWLPKPRGHKS